MGEVKQEIVNNPPLIEKCYSLRPRTATKKEDDSDCEEIISVAPSWKSNRGRTSKKKTAPLSKYRRKNANARERSRMREINDAFESLRRVVQPNINDEKITKIATLRLAMKYISRLTQTLSNGNESSSSLSSTMSEISSDPSFSPLHDLDSIESTIDTNMDDVTDFDFEELGLVFY